MKAVVYEKYGGPEVLQLKEVANPELKDNEVMIKVKAVAVNYGDVIARNFKNISSKKFHMPWLMWFPAKIAFGLNKPRMQTLGNELSGVVEKWERKFLNLKKVTRFLFIEVRAWAVTQSLLRLQKIELLLKSLLT